MGHYDSAYEYEQMYGRAPHQSELQKANSKIRDLEARIKELEKESKQKGVKFTVNGVDKFFTLEISELDEDTQVLWVRDTCLFDEYIVGVSSKGMIVRPRFVTNDGWITNKHTQVKIDKEYDA